MIFDNVPMGDGCSYCGMSGGRHASRCPNSEEFFDEPDEVPCDICGDPIKRGQEYMKVPISEPSRYGPTHYHLHTRCTENMTAFDFIKEIMDEDPKEYGEE